MNSPNRSSRHAKSIGLSLGPASTRPTTSVQACCAKDGSVEWQGKVFDGWGNVLGVKCIGPSGILRNGKRQEWLEGRDWLLHKCRTRGHTDVPPLRVAFFMFLVVDERARLISLKVGTTALFQLSSVSPHTAH